MARALNSDDASDASSELGGSSSGAMSRDERARASLEASTSSSATTSRSGTDDLIAGVVAGAACTLAGHPFDTVKVFLQDHAAKGARAHTTASATREIYSRRGVRGLYAGVAAPLIGASLETGANYACFHLIREGVALDAAGGRDGFASRLGASAVSGAIAGAAMCAFLTPFELVKCRAQVGQGGGRAVAVAREIVAQGGVSGLFRGFTHTMMREVPAGAVYFASYEALQTMFPRARRSEDVTRAAFEEQNASGARFRARFVSSRLFSRRLFSRPPRVERTLTARAFTHRAGLFLEALAAASCGGAAGVVTWLAVLPLDNAKTIYQCERPGGPRDLPPLALIRRLITERGFRGLYRGASPVIARAFPANAAQWLAWEFSSRALWARRAASSDADAHTRGA